MKTSRFLTLCGLLVTSGGVVLAANALAQGKPTSKKLSARKVPAVSNYRNWTLANAEPHYVDARPAAACAPANFENSKSAAPSRSENPHAGKWIRVFVNEVGRVPLLEQKVPVFPVGSVIVKEKLPQKDSENPELLTVMIKRAAGFDAKNGDWEYYALNGTATQTYSSGKLANCQACHIPQKENGYVFRHYLPADVREALK